MLITDHSFSFKLQFQDLPPAHPKQTAVGNHVVFIDIAPPLTNVDNKEGPSRITIELFSEIYPKMSESFRAFMTGEVQFRQKPIGFVHSSASQIEAHQFIKWSSYGVAYDISSDLCTGMFYVFIILWFYESINIDKIHIQIFF